MTVSDEVRARIDAAFGDVPIPDRFTDADHCEECAEHDATLRGCDRNTIGLEQLGNPGWDPMCFVLPEAFLYYFPAMVRMVLGRDTSEGYLEQFLFHVTYEGENSRFFRHFSGEQRRATLALLRYLRETMKPVLEARNLESEINEAIALWERLAAGP